MKYTYSLGLLLGAYLLYPPNSKSEHLFFLCLLLLLSAVGFMLEHISHYPHLRAWIDRIF